MLDTDTYGPRLVENIVQATARDCLAHILVCCQLQDYPVVFHVHDEVVIEERDGRHEILSDLLAIMAGDAQLPWQDGLILEGAGYECDFYQKD